MKHTIEKSCLNLSPYVFWINIVNCSTHTKKNQDISYMHHTEIEFKLSNIKMSTSTSLTELIRKFQKSCLFSMHEDFYNSC